ncbi:hypothetical protein ACIBCR_15040 [Micromonospora echinospora]|uniref:hypothetical protein n=1 Tax=Micromonospora echinospora TaxID=1877 RepID=UPI0037BB8E92
MSPRMRRARTITAWILLAGSLAGWPLCAFWLARNEPPVVLGLSFLAIIIESASLLTASQVHEDTANNNQ